MPLGLTLRRDSWPARLAVAVGSTAAALALTHALWDLVRITPFVFGFAAAVLSSRLGGRAAGFLAVALGVVGYAWFPLPLPADGFWRPILGYVAISGTFSWIVARRDEIEADLRASQQRLRAVVSSVPVALWAMNRDGVVTFAEGGGVELMDPGRRELVGRSVFDVYGEVPGIVANAGRALGGETFTALAAHGDAVVETWYSALRDQHGLVIGALGVSLDVTARRRLEEQYLQAQKMEAVGQLAAGIAHDFNNLLVAMGGYAELVMASLEVSDARRSDLLEIRKSAGRASDLIRQLLAFSRRQVLDPRALDLNALIGNVQKLLRRTIGEDVELVLDLSPAVAPVRADPAQLEHVLLNLAVNARDAMPAGGRLRFTTEIVEVDEPPAGRPPSSMTPGPYVRLTVADTGTGMTPEVQARIFEPFFTTKDRDGTGLGLATVYGIVEQSDGVIEVNSRPGHGTAFEIYLPAVGDAVEDGAEPDEAGSAVGGTETILLAEDDEGARRLAGEVLQRWGYAVIEAGDGIEALSLARSHRGDIDLLVADLIMPGLNGRTLAARLAEARPSVRVLYTSGYAAAVASQAGIGRGVPFLAKPFLPVDLVRAVRKALDAPAAVS